MKNVRSRITNVQFGMPLMEPIYQNIRKGADLIPPGSSMATWDCMQLSAVEQYYYEKMDKLRTPQNYSKTSQSSH